MNYLKHPFQLIHLSLFFISSGIISVSGQASEFDQVWKQIEDHSLEIQAQSSAYEAARLSSQRSSRHWLPQLSLGAQWFSSHQPGAALFSQLNARQVESSDFTPNRLNHPSRDQYKNANLILHLPLYEGGAKNQAHQGYQLLKESEGYRTTLKKKEIFAQFVQNYSTLLSLKSEQEALQKIEKRLTRLIQGYRLGSKNNPLGYSGLLGMKSLLNRVQSLLIFNENTSLEALGIIRNLAGNSQIELKLDPALKSADFSEQKLSLFPLEKGKTDLMSESLTKQAQAQLAFSKAKKAHWLPQVGLFASEDWSETSRGHGASTQWGAYLQWKLFDGVELGSYREAFAQAQSAEYQSRAIQNGNRLAREVLLKNISDFKPHLNRLAESSQWTEEQVQVTERLFKNGSVNILQFVEVLSHQVDLIDSVKETEIAWVNLLGKNYLLNQ